MKVGLESTESETHGPKEPEPPATSLRGVLRRNAPIVRTAAGASLGWVGMVGLGRAGIPGPVSPALGLWFLAGLLYMQFVEYGIHRFLMHRGVLGSGNIRENHVVHHRIFCGRNFRSADAEQLATIPGRWWIFPAVGGAHYVVLRLLVSPDAAAVFMLACMLHYVAFEVTHWFTHFEGNGVDRLLRKIPGIRVFWARQVEHHRVHHATLDRAFNFCFPYLGDRIIGAQRARLWRGP
jgi:hypothetical protein